MANNVSAAYDMILNDRSKVGRDAFLKSVNTIDNKLAAMAVGGFAAITVAGVGAFTALYNAQAPLIDQLGKTTQTLQINVVAYQAMEDAASRAGIGVDQLSGSMQEGLKRISEASAGAGEAGKILKKLGLEASDLQKLAPEERIYAVLDALEQVANVGDKIQFADKIFGGSGVDLIRLFTRDIQNAEQEMRNLGIALEEVDVENVERLNDEIQRIGRLSSQSSKLFVSAMSPAIIAVMETMFSLQEANIDVRGSFIGVADTAIEVLGWVGDRINDVRRFVKGLEFTFQDMGTNLYRLLDKIPGMDFGTQIEAEFNKGIKIYGEYLAIDENGKFSERLKANLKQVRADAEGAAKAIAESQAAAASAAANIPTGDTGLGGKSSANDAGDKIETAVQKKLDQERAAAERLYNFKIAVQERDLERIRQYGLSEFEVLIESQQRTADLLDAVAERDKGRAEEVATIREAANQRYHDQYIVLLKRRQVESNKREKAQMDAGRSYVEQGIAHFAEKSEGADALHKALVARRMFREGREAVIGAYKWGNSIGGPWMGAAMAGIAIVYTAALINEAVGGGGSASSAPTGGDASITDGSSETSSTSSNSTTAAQSVQNITFNAYFTKNIPESDRDSMARAQFEKDMKDKNIIIGDNVNVKFNTYDYEEYGT